jgi:integrase
VYADGKSEAQSFGADEAAAREAARRINEAAAARAEWAAGSGSVGVEAALRAYLEMQAPLLSRGTQATVRSAIDVHLVPYFRNRPLEGVTESDIRAFAAHVIQTETTASVARRARAERLGRPIPDPKTASPATVQNALSTLRRVANLAVEAGIIRAHRLGDVQAVIDQAERTAGAPVRPPDAWTHDEVGTLLACAREWEKALHGPLLCALQTGARRGEVLGLRWPAVDFARNRIRFGEQVTRGQRKRTKWGKRRLRELPMAPTLREFLGRLAAERPNRQPWTPPDVVFLSPEGYAWQERNFARAYERLRARAHAEAKVRPLNFHCTRHTWISWALEAGRSPTWVAEKVAATPAVILETYAHVIPRPAEDLAWAEPVTQRGGTADRTRPYRIRSID